MPHRNPPLALLSMAELEARMGEVAALLSEVAEALSEHPDGLRVNTPGQEEDRGLRRDAISIDAAEWPAIEEIDAMLRAWRARNSRPASLRGRAARPSDDVRASPG